MLYVGLTGGIASGKSLVSARMAEAGMKVMDADEISRDLTAEGGAAVTGDREHVPGHGTERNSRSAEARQHGF